MKYRKGGRYHSLRHNCWLFDVKNIKMICLKWKPHISNDDDFGMKEREERREMTTGRCFWKSKIMLICIRWRHAHPLFSIVIYMPLCAGWYPALRGAHHHKTTLLTTSKEGKKKKRKKRRRKEEKGKREIICMCNYLPHVTTAPSIEGKKKKK